MNEVIEILKSVGAILPNGHFVGTSGLHFDAYINKDNLYPYTRETSHVCRLFAEKYKDKNIETVVAPALGGIVLSQWVTYHLNELGGNTVAAYTEKTLDNGQAFTRGYDKHVKGRRVLIVEDNVATGGSIMKVIKAVREAGGNIVGVCVMVNRNKKIDSKFLGVPFDALSSLYVPSYQAAECPLCKAGIPINTTLGHGKKFLTEKKL